jgi:hypothetical protein
MDEIPSGLENSRTLLLAEDIARAEQPLPRAAAQDGNERGNAPAAQDGNERGDAPEAQDGNERGNAPEAHALRAMLRVGDAAPLPSLMDEIPSGLLTIGNQFSQMR